MPGYAAITRGLDYGIPHSPTLELEHEELQAELAQATQVRGKLGDAAKAVAKILHPHFQKEEEYAFPPLGLLPLLAEGKVTPEMGEVLHLTDHLKVGLHQMLEEHKAIVAALKSVSLVAKRERKMQYVRFADRLMVHAMAEQEVLYPTAIVIGEYIKLKLGKSVD